MSYLEKRPWGYYQVLADTPEFKIKKIFISPGKRLSLQTHQKRTEHWLILKGVAQVTLNEQVYILEKAHSIDIPQGAKHRIENAGEDNLEFIEIQTGSYFGEDDIVRYQDDFGRA